jgi:type VI secretion system lysozyme-like protein
VFLSQNLLKLHSVARAPLFDQLTVSSEFQNELPNVCIFLDKEQLMQSIQKELSDIFNSRSSYSFDVVDNMATAGESFLPGIEGLMGLPNLRNSFPEGGSGWNGFERQCEMMIRLYETRIKNPVVKIESFEPCDQKFVMSINGSVSFGNYREHVSFPLTVDATR